MSAGAGSLSSPSSSSKCTHPVSTISRSFSIQWVLDTSDLNRQQSLTHDAAESGRRASLDTASSAVDCKYWWAISNVS